MQIKSTQQYVKCYGKSIANHKNKITGLIILFEDISKLHNLNIKAELQTEKIIKTQQFYDNILNASPYLIWQHNLQLQLEYANKTYHNHFGQRCINIKHGSGNKNTHKHFNIHGQRRILSISSTHNDHSITHFAHDITHISNLQNKILKTEEIHKNIIMNLSIPIALYGKNKCINLYNNAFVNFWKLEKKWLNTHPTYKEVCDKTCQYHQKLKYDDLYNIDIFMNIIQPCNRILSLSKNQHLHVTIIPALNHSLWFIYEHIKNTNQEL